ncbi:MAG: Jag N-terminal domain-containing protein [Candidatus Omnitrophica bacterium]|nr:Jag N-terminal domain-containing protein [Candidatus Omnitrophota bacterium]
MNKKNSKDNKQESDIKKEYEGSTVEEAIEKALNDLKLSKDKVKIKILREGTRGLFGMEGAKKAKIQVTVLLDNDKTP